MNKKCYGLNSQGREVKERQGRTHTLHIAPDGTQTEQGPVSDDGLCSDGNRVCRYISDRQSVGECMMKVHLRMASCLLST